MTYVMTAVLVSILTLACQKTFGNVVSGINLFVTHPFVSGIGSLGNIPALKKVTRLHFAQQQTTLSLVMLSNATLHTSQSRHTQMTSVSS